MNGSRDRRRRRAQPPLDPPRPANPACAECHGSGWLRRDLPAWHKDFGRPIKCSCVGGGFAQEVSEQEPESGTGPWWAR